VILLHHRETQRVDAKPIGRCVCKSLYTSYITLIH